MSLIGNSIRFNKERVSHESLLRFDKTLNQAIEINDSNSKLFNVIRFDEDWSFRFLCKPESAESGVWTSGGVQGIEVLCAREGGTNKLQIRLIVRHTGTTQHYFTCDFYQFDGGIDNTGLFICWITFDSGTGDFECYVNGVSIGVFNWAVPEDFTPPGNIYSIGINTFGAGSLDFEGLISNIYWVAKKVSVEEIESDHSKGGVAVDSIMKYIVAPYYTLGQLKYFKADAAFIAKHAYLALNDLVCIDSSPQFNERKNYANEGVTLTDYTVVVSGTDAVIQGAGYIEIQKNDVGVSEPEINKLSILHDGAGVEVIVRVDIEEMLANAVTGFTARYGNGSASVTLAASTRAVIELQISTADSSDDVDLLINAIDTTAPKAVRIYSVEIFEKGQDYNVPIHGKMVNYTDDQLGFNNLSTQEKISDVYHKAIRRHLGFRFDGVKNGTMGSASAIAISGDWTFTVKINPIIRPYRASAGNTYYLWSGVSNVSAFVLRGVVAGASLQTITFELSWTEGATNLVRSIFTYSDKDLASPGQRTSRNLILTMRKSSGIVSYFVNGVKMSFTDNMTPDATTLDANTTWGSRNTGVEKIDNVSIYGSEWHSAALTDDQIYDIQSGVLLENTGLIFRHNWAADKLATVHNEIASHDITMSAITEDLIHSKHPIPIVSSGLQHQYNVTFMQLPASLISNLSTGDYTIMFDYYIDRPDGYPSSTVNILQTAGGLDGNFFIYTVNPFQFRCGVQGATSVVTAMQPISVVPESIQTVFFRKKGAGFVLPPTNSRLFSINGNYKTLQSSAIPNDHTPDFSAVTALNFTDDCYLFRIAFFERELTDKDIQSIRNNSLLGVSDLDALNCIGYYDSNASAFYENGVNVKCLDRTGISGDANMLGFVGGTTALQLTDLLSNLASKDSLI